LRQFSEAELRAAVAAAVWTRQLVIMKDGRIYKNTVK
jgi:hypothetical protein